MKRRALAITAVVALLVAGGAIYWRMAAKRAAKEEAVAELVASATQLLRAEDLRREQMVTLSRTLKERSAGLNDPRLIRMRARLELALGRIQDAWDAEAELALGLQPAPEDALLSARILMRRYGIRGDPADVERAMQLAAEHFALTKDHRSLFLAWQCARRAGQSGAEQSFAKTLRDDHADTTEARLVAALDEQASLDALRELEIAFARAPHDRDETAIPEELEFALALAAVEAPTPDVDAALRHIDAVLATFPASVDARSVAAVALHRKGDQARRDAHLDWLLQNAPENDQRRDGWAALRAQPAGGT